MARATSASTQVPPSAPGPLLVSVVVPARNAGGELGLLVEALGRQTVPRERFEVVVGDDGSTDGSTVGLGSGDGWVRVAAGEPRNSYAARNRAAGLARSPVLAFCDADCRPEPSWLEAGLAALEDADVAGGLVRFDVPEQRTLWALLDVDMNLDQERAVQASRAATANLFVRRELFDRLGGFDESLPNTSDFDFVGRAVESGARLEFAGGAVVRHPTRDTAGALLGKLWAVNHRYAARESRAGRRPAGLALREWVPFVQPLRSRKRFGRSLGLDRRRLGESGVTPGLSEDLRALPLMYGLVPYVAGVAQLAGWWEGRRPR